MGRSQGTGSPVWFLCPQYRRDRNLWGGSRNEHNVTLTGRTKPARFNGAPGLRSTHTSREYACECGHVGWSNHVDLERMASRQD